MMSKLVANLLLTAIGLIPFRVRASMGRLFGKLFALVPSRERRTAELQLAAFLPDENPKTLAREVFGHIGALISESFNLDALLKHPEQHLECPNTKFIGELLARKQPVIALTAHTGNWEVMAAHMVSLGVPVVTVGRQIRNSLLQAIIEEHRSRYGVKTIWRGGIAGQKELISELKAGSAVAALIDQDTRVSSVFSPFFGVPVSTPSALIELGKRHDAVFVTAFSFRKRDGRFITHVEELPSNLSAQQLIDTYNQRLESYIRKYPEQWVWFHKRWRTLQDGGRLSTSDYQKFLSSQT